MDFKDAIILFEHYEKHGKIISKYEVEDFYDNCPAGYEVEETKILNPYGGYYVTIGMRYVLSDEDEYIS